MTQEPSLTYSVINNPVGKLSVVNKTVLQIEILLTPSGGNACSLGIVSASQTANFTSSQIEKILGKGPVNVVFSYRPVNVSTVLLDSSYTFNFESGKTGTVIYECQPNAPGNIVQKYV